MRSNFRLIAAALLLVNLTGCDKVSKYFAKEEPFRKEAPDLGGVKVVEVEAKGVGPTRSAAILDAINVALQQQNGTSMAALQLGSLAPDNQNIVALTQGSVQGFSVISEREGDAAHPWQIKLKVKVNSYQAPSDAKLPKVVVATPRTHQGSYVIGDQTLSASEASATMAGIIGEAVRKSNRFTLVKRDFDDEIDSEIDHIAPGSSPPAEMARLGQRLTADILIIPEINTLAYRKSTRLLHFSGRELNSYAGGVDLSFHVINVTTGQLILTEHFATSFPATPPLVYGGQRVGIGSVNAWLAQVSDRFTRRFILKNFPIAVVRLDGRSVIVNQGAGMVKAGEVYNAVALGDEMKDPQTGQSLGRLETAVGTVQIIRVADRMAFGTLNGQFDAAKFQPGMIELRSPAQNSEGGEDNAPAVASGPGAPGAPGVPGAVAPAAKPVAKARAHRSRDEFDAPFDN